MNKRLISTLVVILILLFCLTGCGSASKDMVSTAMEAPATESYVYDEEYEVDNKAYGEYYEGESTSSVVATMNSSERKIIRNAYLSLEIADYNNTVKTIETKLNILGGYITSQNLYNGYDDRKSGNISIKVPYDEFDAFMTFIREMGDVDSENIYTEDVTAEYIDISARIKVYEEKIAKLESLMEKTNTLSEVLELENAITTTQADLEALKGRINYLNDQTVFSSISMDIYEKDKGESEIQLTGFEGFVQRVKDSFFRGTNDFIESLGDFIVNFAGAIVGIVFVIIILLIIAGIVKKTRKNKKSKIDKEKARKVLTEEEQNKKLMADLQKAADESTGKN